MTPRKKTKHSLMLHQGEHCIISLSLLPCSPQLSAVLLILLVKFFLIPGHLACPPSCVCTGTPDWEVSCQNGRLLDIFTQIDNRTKILLLDHVVDIQVIKKDRIQDLKATEIVKLCITSSFVKEIEDGALNQLSRLEELDLGGNELAAASDLSLAGLTELKVLNLSHNHLSSLGQSPLSVSLLERLDLSSNYLKDLPANLFSSLKMLTFLKLDSNPLKQLRVNMFSGLTSVKELRVRDCDLFLVEDDIFLAMSSLTILDLGHNKLTTTPTSAALSRLNFLVSLYLDNNDIQALPPSAFQNVHLLNLDLSYNRISKIDTSTFVGAHIATLDLSFNSILSLSSDILKPLSSSLVHLNLARNPLKILQIDIFDNFLLLESLNISSSFLEAVEYKQISELPALKKLDLSHNNLHFISNPVIALLDKIDSVSLYDNSWVCECQIKPLRDWLRSATSQSKLSCLTESDGCISQPCMFPSALHQRQVVEVEDHELGPCPQEKSSTLPAGAQGAIVASCLGFSIVLLIITIFLWRRGRTHQGLKRMCVPSEAESSHIVDEESKVPALIDCDRRSLTMSDHNFVFRHYFDHLVTDPKLMAGEGEGNEEVFEDEEGAAAGVPGVRKERDSLYSSQPSLYSTHSDAGYGMESTV